MATLGKRVGYSLGYALSGDVTYQTYQTILASVQATWVGYWTTFDPGIGSNPGLATSSTLVDSWTDQRSGIVVPAIATGNRPTLASDPGYFLGRKVVQMAVSGSKFLQGDHGSNVLASGGKPYFVIVTRNRSAPSISGSRILEISDTLTFRALPLALALVDQSEQNNLGGGSNTRGAASVDRSPHCYASYVTTANFLRRDGGSNSSSAFSSGLSGNANRITIGAFRDGTGNFGDNSVAELHIFTAYPGDAIAAAFERAVKQKWGIP